MEPELKRQQMEALREQREQLIDERNIGVERHVLGNAVGENVSLADAYRRREHNKMLRDQRQQRRGEKRREQGSQVTDHIAGDTQVIEHYGLEEGRDADKQDSINAKSTRVSSDGKQVASLYHTLDYTYQVDPRLELSDQESDTEGSLKVEYQDVRHLIDGRTAEIKLRNERLLASQKQLQVKELELSRREEQTRRRELELKRKQQLMERSKMEEMQEDMYNESKEVLDKLERELIEKQTEVRQKETDLIKREQDIKRMESQWEVFTSTPKKVKEQFPPEIKEEGLLLQQVGTPGKSCSPETTEGCDIKAGIGTQVNSKTHSPLQLEKEWRYELRGDFATAESSMGIYPKKREQTQPLGASGEMPVVIDKAIKGMDMDKRANIQFMKPTLNTFSGMEPRPRNESTFEEWKMEIESILALDIYPDYMISQTLRKSLKGQAKKVLLPMGALATPSDILKKMESVFGNVATGESVLQEFYNSQQLPEESVSEWGLRLEEVMHKAIGKGHVKEEQRNSMLKNKFWRSLFDTDLKNATRVHFETEESFEMLRRKVRAEEYEIKSTAKDISRVKKNEKVARTQQVTSESYIMADKMKMLETLVKKMETMEKKMEEFEKGKRRGGWRDDRRRSFTNDNTKEQKQQSTTEKKKEGATTGHLNK